jgi:hypothetical protein
MAARTTFILLAAFLGGCVGGGSTNGTGGTGGAGGTGGGGGTGGSSGGPLPDYKTTVLSGKIAGKVFTFVTGFVAPAKDDASAMQIEMLGFSPELGSTPCWNKPPSGSNPDTELSVVFRVPKEGGSFEWGGGKTISGFTVVSLLSLNTDGSTRTSPSDRAKVTIGAMPTQASAPVSGQMVIEADANNSINGTFDVRRCDR